MTKRKARRWPKCARDGCERPVMRGGVARGGLCGKCWRTSNRATDEIEQSEAVDSEPVKHSPLTAERLIEQWGRA